METRWQLGDWAVSGGEEWRVNGDHFSKKLESEREEKIQKLGKVTHGKGFYLKNENINYLITQMIGTL